MEERNMILRETLVIAIGQAVCVAVMFAVFAALRLFDSTVLFGGLLGAVLATANFLFMGIGISLAADRAEQQNVKGGKGLMQMSFIVRYGLLFLGLFLGAKSGKCNLIALLLPLLFVRPTLMVREFFGKKEEKRE